MFKSERKHKCTTGRKSIKKTVLYMEWRWETLPYETLFQKSSSEELFLNMLT